MLSTIINDCLFTRPCLPLLLPSTLCFVGIWERLRWGAVIGPCNINSTLSLMHAVGYFLSSLSLYRRAEEPREGESTRIGAGEDDLGEGEHLPLPRPGAGEWEREPGAGELERERAPPEPGRP